MVPALSISRSQATGGLATDADLVHSQRRDIGRSPQPSPAKDMTTASPFLSQSTGPSSADADLVRSYLRDIGARPPAEP